MRTRKYIHYDGSRCTLTDNLWVITKLPSMGIGHDEEIGDPCQYCNRYPDVTVRRADQRSWVNKLRLESQEAIVHGTWAIFLCYVIGAGQIIGLVFDLFTVKTVGWHYILLRDVAPLPPALLLGWIGWDWLRWESGRDGGTDRT